MGNTAAASSVQQGSNQIHDHNQFQNFIADALHKLVYHFICEYPSKVGRPENL